MPVNGDGMEIVRILLSFVAICVVIAVGVWAMFLLGSFLGVQWYVSAVAILLVGYFLLSQLMGGG